MSYSPTTEFTALPLYPHKRGLLEFTVSIMSSIDLKGKLNVPFPLFFILYLPLEYLPSSSDTCKYSLHRSSVV